MIDLHIHSNFSDGDLSVEEILSRVTDQEIKLFSIVDHNTAQAYDTIDLDDYPQLIVGVEIMAVFNDEIIELIGYDVDHHIINEWALDYYQKEHVEEISFEYFTDMLSLFEAAGWIVDSEIEVKNINLHNYKKKAFDYIKALNEDFPYESYSSFLKEELENSESIYYMDETLVFPQLDDVIHLLRDEAKGKVFLAHPFEYNTDIITLLQMVLDKELDGVEVFHPSASMKHSLELLDFCETYHKCASMGSDFHSDKRRVPIGVHVTKDLYNLSCFNWLRNRIKED